MRHRRGRVAHLLLYSTEELEHGDVGGRLGHAQGHTDPLQLQEHRGASPRVRRRLLGLGDEDHPGGLQLRYQECCGKNMEYRMFTLFYSKGVCCHLLVTKPTKKSNYQIN